MLKDLQRVALEEGVNIASEEFEEILLKAKEKLLLDRGISLEEYTEMMKELNEKKKKINKVKEDKALKIEGVEMLRGYTGEKGKDGKDGKDAIIDYDKIIKEALKKIPKPKDGKDGKTIIKEKEIIKELDENKLEDVKKDIVAMQEAHQDLYKKVEDIKVPNIKEIKEVAGKEAADSANKLLLDMPNFRALAGGLRGDVDDLQIKKITGDGVKKITVGLTAPSNPSIGDLWCDVS
jgi:hypothetical protein